MSENTIIFPANLPEVQFLGKSQQKMDPSQNTNFASGQNRRRRLFGATPVYHEVRWVFTADQSRAFESFFENDLEGGSRKFLMQISSVNGKDYQLFQFEEVYTGPDKIAGDAYVVSAKLIQFTFDKEYIEVRLPFTEVRSTDHTVSVVRKIGPDGAPDFDLSVGGSGKVLIADYGITTFSEINNALNDGKVVLLRIHPLPSTRQYALISSALGGQAFTFSRVTAEKLYTYTCTGLGWSQSSSDLGGGGGTGIFVLPYETATYAQINGYAQSGKQVVIHYAGVDDDQFWTLSHKNDEFSYVFTWLNGNSLVKMTLSSGNVWSEKVIDLKAIKDNAYDSDDNITEVQELTFFRNQGTGANYPILSSEERTYGVLLPAPALQADQGKVPMYKVGDKIVWETVPSPDSVSAEIADAVATVKTNNIFTIQLGAIQKVITPTGSGTLYSHWTIISPSMDFPLSEKTTLSFIIKQLGECTKAYLAIYEIDIYNQKKKWVANTNDFHASLALGYNYVNLAYINSSARLSSDKFYYVCLISNINSFQFAGNSYDTLFNGVPRLANKIDNINAEFNAATMQTVYNEFGLTEGSEILDRLFFNISNVERIIDPVDPTPFIALTNITLGHTKNVGNLVPMATTFGANGILYQKVTPQMDITIKSVWVFDYHSSQNPALLSLFILDEDLNSLTSVNVPTLTNAGTSEKIGKYYVHKYAFSTPITLQEGKGYWMPAIGNCSNGTSEWAIQYTAADPSIPIRGMLAVSDITNFAIADKVIANNKNGCYLKLIDITDTEWQI